MDKNEETEEENEEARRARKKAKKKASREAKAAEREAADSEQVEVIESPDLDPPPAPKKRGRPPKPKDGSATKIIPSHSFDASVFVSIEQAPRRNVATTGMNHVVVVPAWNAFG